jgi:hypothetical protein
MSFLKFSSLFALALSLAGPAAAQALPLIELSAGIHRIEAEVVNTQQTRMTGLMHRRTMATQRGMLFVFDDVRTHCMWMKNTYIPLSVAFLDEGGRIINVEDMQPHTEDNHCAAKPARYALEMNIGWFRSRNLGVGVPLAGIDRAPPAR